MNKHSLTHSIESYSRTKWSSFNRIVMFFLKENFAFWLPYKTHEDNLALFLNLIGDVTVFSNIRTYPSCLWAVMISTFFVCSMKTLLWSERGLSCITRLWIKSLRFDLFYTDPIPQSLWCWLEYWYRKQFVTRCSI